MADRDVGAGHIAGRLYLSQKNPSGAGHAQKSSLGGAQAKSMVKLCGSYRQLLTVSGIGPVLGMTIMLETGPIGRFKSAVTASPDIGWTAANTAEPQD